MGGQGSDSRPIVIAAGGTGGHLFPAQALAQELKSRGHVTHLMTDSRVDQLAGAFPGEEVHQIPSATFGLRKPLRIPPALIKLYRGYRLARRIMKRCNVRAAVGFGGYPTLPPMFAATRLGLPACLHEQNAVIGRANRLLASRVDMIAGAFPSPGHLTGDLEARYRITGNPVRQVAKEYAAAPYDTPATGDEFRLLVFGGSQGARIMSDIVPAAIAAMTDRSGLRIVQQCREEDMERVGKVYDELGVDAEIAPFFKDLPQKIAASHLVVCRSGASTVAELSVIGRPAIMVPLPHSLDNDQRENARHFETAGGGWMVEQTGFTPDRLADMLQEMRQSGDDLARRSAAAIAFGRPDAERELADAIEDMIAKR